MIQLVLKQEYFICNKFTFLHGDKEVLFTIVDEEFMGMNILGKINRIVITVSDGDNTTICTTVIGYGDGIIGIKSDKPELRGKLLNKDNMEDCIIELYEEGD